MEHKLLVLCDPEEDYAQQMADYLRRKKDAFWEIRTFTKAEELISFGEGEAMEILLVAEAAFGDYVKKLQVKVPILLNESGVITNRWLPNVDKYQAAERVRQEILAHYMERSGETFPRVRGSGKGKLIGMYSPVRRCLQTTFALTMGQLLAEGHRTLYISFEHYSGLEEWQEYRRQDLSTLLYYQQNKQETLPMHMQTLVRKVGNLDYVAPMINGENLLYITSEEWKQLLEAIVQSGEYEYVILDLSESMQGLFEILRMCCKVYTIIQEEAKALQKLYRYEQLLVLQEYEDVKEKTAKCRLPSFRRLPTELEQYTKGELAEYIRGMLKGDEANDPKGL